MKQGWEIKKLGEVATYVNGYAFKPEHWGETGVPIIRIQNLNNLNADLLDGYNASDFVLKEDLNKDSGVNKFEYINIDSAYTLSFNKYTSFSILSNGNTVKFPSSYNNGLEVHIYTIDDTNIDTGTEVIHSIAGEYNIFRCVPISREKYSWNMVSDNN